MTTLTAPNATAPSPIHFSIAHDVLHASFSLADLYSDACISPPVEVPRDPWLLTGTGLKGRIKQALAPIGFERPLSAPAPAFWSVFARQRGLAKGEAHWLRDNATHLFSRDMATSFSAIMDGTIAHHDWTIAACVQRPVGRRGLRRLTPVRERGLVVFSARCEHPAVEDQMQRPTGSFPVGWSLKNKVFTAWLHVPAGTIELRGKDVPVPLVSEALVDWACMQAVNAAAACGVPVSRSTTQHARSAAA